MGPFLKDGDIALVEKAGHLLHSDIIVFRYKGDIISHRLIRRIKGRDESILYQTMADKGICLDAPVARDDVIGKVIAVEKDGRVVRIDTITGYIKNLIYWCKDIIKLVICKYGGKRDKI